MSSECGLSLKSAAAAMMSAVLFVGCADSDPSPEPQGASDLAQVASASGDDRFGDPNEADTTGLECYKLTAHSGDLTSKYKVGVARDKYLNFTWKAPWTGVLYAKLFRPIIDNKQAIHHWLLFQDFTPAPIGPAKPALGAHPNAQLLSGWAPGGEATNLINEPDDVGQDLPGNTTYTIEYHYNSNDPNAMDASGVEICGTREKPKNVAGLAWLGWDQLGIPAQKWTGTCRPQGPLAQQPIKILGLTPHMHKTGRHMKVTVNRKDGQKEVIHDEPFDFEYQRSYRKNITINPGDTITTECTFAKPMAFGESTEAEMCYAFTLSYPKGALRDNGLWGSLAHGGGACLGQ